MEKPDERDRVVGDAEFVRGVFDALPIAVAVTQGPEHRVVAANTAYRALTGRPAPGGAPTRELFPELAGQQVYEMLDRVYASGVPETIREWRMHLVDQETAEAIEVSLNCEFLPHRSAAAPDRSMIVIVTDVSDRVRERHAAQERAELAEQRYAHAADVIASLQRALLPAGLPVLPQARIAASYLPAEADTAAGGDWFDAVVLPAGRVALVVGDVVGHGVAASATMSQLRAVLHDRLEEDGDIVAALAAADRVAARVPGARAATVCVAVLDTADGSIRYCTAGHPPPLIAAPGSDARYLPPTGSGPLASGRPPVVADAQLDEGAVLVLYSDGILERPGRHHGQAVAELLQVASDAAADRALPDPEATAARRVCDQTIELLVRATGHADDITILAAQRTPPAPGVDLETAATPDSVRAVHRTVAGWLAGVGGGSGDLVAVQHAIGELVTNVVDHAYADEPGPLTVTGELREDGTVRIEVCDRGRWRERSPAISGQRRGLGLVMAGAMVDDLRIDHGAGGTTATLTHRLAGPARLLDADGLAPVPPPGRGRTDPELLLILEQPAGPPPAIRLDGPVTALTSGMMARELRRLTAGGTRDLTVDLTGVTVLASAGVAVLQQATAMSREHGRQLRLFAPSGTVAQHVLSLVAIAHDTGKSS
ncbi:SpoIIE family protein phosphatase [Actinoplanes italicus]|uniref:SpoIIE family protein phosphatase n=1 Tax=Actinoplanes italicus TaxID=113567 RepID=UPI001EF3900C|nr:SpoIIE family protein phosphatase [Actinoplanes italicus]